jgi:SPX domain protein involved in polyphosphate accumulation
LEDLYATASNLQNYVQANRTGFRKILKKHDKLTSVRQGQEQRGGNRGRNKDEYGLECTENPVMLNSDAHQEV